MATVTIGTGAGIGTPDYSSISAWWSALPATLTSNETAQIRWASSANELTTTDTSIYGGKDMAGFRVTIEAYQGESFRDNANKLSNRLAYDANNGACIRATATNAKCLAFNPSGRGSFTIRNLQLKTHTSGGYQTTCVNISTCFSNVIENNIMEGNVTTSTLLYIDSNTAGASNSTTTTIQNNVIVVKGTGVTATNFRRNGTADAYKIYGNTAINVAASAGTTIGLRVLNQYHDYEFFNNISIGFATDYNMPSGSSVKLDGNNATDKASGASGIRTTASSVYDVSGASVFQSVVSGAEDVRLRASAATLINTGNSSYGSTVDILDQVRVGTYDIGAFEYQPPIVPPSFKVYYMRRLSASDSRLAGFRLR